MEENDAKLRLHQEFQALLMVLQLVTYRTNGSSSLSSDLEGKPWYQDVSRSSSSLSFQVVLEAISCLLVLNHQVMTVVSTGPSLNLPDASAPKPSKADKSTPSSVDEEVMTVFAMQDAPYMDVEAVPLTNFAALNNPENPCNNLQPDMSISLIAGVSSWNLIYKNPWYGFRMRSDVCCYHLRRFT